ncbi:MAG: hypothetical protein HRU26_15220, partial [Psychroserpens sp.]|nr:hypothetical protein [Psychroserpens sp.]
MKPVFLSLVLLLFMNCSEKETQTVAKELPENNPFNVGLNEPFDYANADGDAIAEYVSFEMDRAAEIIEQIKNEKTPTLDNTFLPFDAVANKLYQANTNAFMLYWTSPDSTTRTKGIEYSKKVDSLNTAISSDKDLFSQFETFAASKEFQDLNDRRKRFVTDIIDGFKQEGVNLPSDKLEEFKTLKAEISDLTSQYSTNMNTANLELTLNEDQTKGLPENFKDTYRQEDDSYKVPAMPSTRGPVMSNAVDADVRKEYQKLYANRGADKNLDILQQLVEKRYQLGQLMG